MATHEFFWLDLETSGLDPHECVILEWAVVLAADDRGGDMSPIAQYSSVLQARLHTAEVNGSLVYAVSQGSDDTLSSVDPFVVNMHTRNGLWAECAASETTLGESEDFLIELVGGAETKGVVLAGSSVHFDLGFIREHMPSFAKCLSHRVLDVSTLKLADKAWAGVAFAKAEAHRALPDVLESLAHAAAIRRSLSKWAQP